MKICSEVPIPKMKIILDMTDYIIDGPYIEGLRNITSMRGSDNQRIINLKENTWKKKIQIAPIKLSDVERMVASVKECWRQ